MNLLEDGVESMGGMIGSQHDLSEMVEEYGFLPFFRNAIPGFSVEEHTPYDLWFADGVDGPWEWKGPVIGETGCAYGKFYAGKAMFISREWFCDFANYRRDGYDLDARYEDGLLRRQDRDLWNVLAEHPSMISREWRHAAGVAKRGEFDAAVNRLQMMGYVTTTDFEYPMDKDGNLYGFGLARYAAPENHFGKEFTDHVYEREPEESGRRMEKYLTNLLPQADEREIRRVIGKRR